jgi:hypothetical protein
MSSTTLQFDFNTFKDVKSMHNPFPPLSHPYHSMMKYQVEIRLPKNGSIKESSDVDRLSCTQSY